MNREQCEQIIVQKFWEIVSIYNEYNPDGKYLSASFIDDEQGRSVLVMNAESGEKEIRVFDDERK